VYGFGQNLAFREEIGNSERRATYCNLQFRGELQNSWVDKEHGCRSASSSCRTGAPPLPRNEQRQIELHGVPLVIREAGSGTRHVLEGLAAREGPTLDDLYIFLVLPDSIG